MMDSKPLRVLVAEDNPADVLLMREALATRFPNVAIEVVSRTNTADGILAKIHDYFEAGVELVWVIYPVICEVYVYQSPQNVRVLTRNDRIDGGKVLPEFQLALSDLFEDIGTAGEAH